VLEVGSGTGEILAALEIQNGIGLDISEAMIARANEKFAGVGRLTFMAGTLETLKMDRAVYDCILLVDVIEHHFRRQFNIFEEFQGRPRELSFQWQTQVGNRC
jgi:ubiquinone/menaquinone biosynthesis C-methylase UbiE